MTTPMTPSEAVRRLAEARGLARQLQAHHSFRPARKRTGLQRLKDRLTGTHPPGCVNGCPAPWPCPTFAAARRLEYVADMALDGYQAALELSLDQTRPTSARGTASTILRMMTGPARKLPAT